MAHLTEHKEDCLKILNNSMEEIHLFLDQYAKIFDVRVFGEYHRTFLHNSYGIKIAQARWGEMGKKAALIHIVKDYIDIPISDWNSVERYIGKSLLYFNNMTNFNLNLDPHIVKSWWPKSLCYIVFK